MYSYWDADDSESLSPDMLKPIADDAYYVEEPLMCKTRSMCI